MKNRKKIISVFLLFIFSVNSFAFSLGSLFGGGGSSSAALIPIELANMNANILSKLELIAQTMHDLEEMERQAKRWKYLFQNLDPSTMQGQITDFYSFVDRYRTYTNRVAQTFNDVSNFENNFYNTFKKVDQIKDMSMFEINKSRKKTKEMVQDSIHDSLKLTVDMTGSNNRDSTYVEQQEAWLDRVTSGEVDPNKIAQATLEAIIQTNNILLELKSINISMLNQLSLIQQAKIEDKKLNEETVRQLVEQNTTAINKNEKIIKSSGEVKY